MKKLFNLIIVFHLLSYVLPAQIGMTSIQSAPKKKKVKSETTELYFLYSDTTENIFLRELRTSYTLDQKVSKARNELDKVLIIMDWVNQRWEHHPANRPSSSDALTILEEAKNGENFRCVEYGIVLSAAMNAIGIKSRVFILEDQGL